MAETAQSGARKRHEQQLIRTFRGEEEEEVMLEREGEAEDGIDDEPDYSTEHFGGNFYSHLLQHMGQPISCLVS